MIHDSITAEIRAIRHALAVKFNNDISRIGDDIRRQQAEDGRTYLRLPRRQPRTQRSTNKPMHGSGEVSPVQMESPSSPPRDR
jgi:hypothetical protein